MLLKKTGLKLRKSSLLVEIYESFNGLTLMHVIIDPLWGEHASKFLLRGLAVPKSAHLFQHSLIFE